MNQRTIRFTMLASLLFLAVAVVDAASLAGKPNFLLIIADDLMLRR
jgi:hypothetical protein